TFPWPLTARITGPVVRVEGDVPSQAVRQQALRVAGQQTNLAVIDGTKVNARLAAPAAGPSGDLLQRSVAAHPQKFFGEHARGTLVTAAGNGQVTLTGSIASNEEKLTVSQSLRAVKGCTSVVNQLQVTALTYGGQPHSAAPAVRQAGYTPPAEPQPAKPAPAPEPEPSKDRWTPFNPLKAFRRTQPTPAPTTPSAGAKPVDPTRSPPPPLV